MFRFHTATKNNQRLLLASASSSRRAAVSSSSSTLSSATAAFNNNNIVNISPDQISSKNQHSSTSFISSQSMIPINFTQTRHQSAAMADKPFKCTVCGKQFRLKTTAEVHIKNVHNGSGSIVETSSSGDSGASSSSSQSPPQQQQQPFSSNINSPPQQPVSQQTTTSSSAAPATPGSRFSTVGARNFATISATQAAGPSERDDRFHREKRRDQKSVKDPLYKASVEISDAIMGEMMEVWDKILDRRFKGKFTTFAEAGDHYAAKKATEDESIPTYETAFEPNTTVADPFAEFLSEEDSEKILESKILASGNSSSSEKNTKATTTEEAEEKKTPSEGESAEKPATADDSTTSSSSSTSSSAPSEIVYHIATTHKSPFVCGAIENPLVTNPNPPTLPKVRRTRSSAAGKAKSSLSLPTIDGEDDGSDLAGLGAGGDQDQQQQDSMNNNSNEGGDQFAQEASPFAQAMQATSPFSVSESSAPIDNTAGQQQQQQVASPFGQTSATTVASPFAQAASSSSPFASFDPSSSASSTATQQQVPPTQQQQEQHQQQQKVASPFADLMSSTSNNTNNPAAQQQQQMQQQGTQTYKAPSTGVPLDPIEAAVDLSSVFGALPGQQKSSDEPQQQQRLICHVCGKDTFKTQYALITHCENKHGIDMIAHLAKTGAGGLEGAAAGLSPTGKKKVRQLPDLPPYIPSPVDLAATSPYGSTRQRATTTAFWSEVELAPVARLMSSITLLGEVESIEQNDNDSDGNNSGEAGKVLGVPCLQFVLYIRETETTEEEKLVVRCFGNDLISHLKDNVGIEKGSSVYVQGLLRLNPSFDSVTNAYYANPAVHVALPNGLVQRMQ